jgi:uncharacterized protein (TIGR00369 family)
MQGRIMDASTAALRSRTYEWQDPLATAAVGRGMKGIDFLQKIIAGEVPQPPIAHTLDYRLVEAAEGRAVFAFQPREFQYNPIGMVHGGIACTLLDSAMGCAVHSVLPAGTGYTTLEVKVNMLRAIGRDTPMLRAEGKLVHCGKSTAVAEGRIVDDAGKLYAFATTTCMLLRAG